MMVDNPLISIIVPVYNVEKYLRQCLDSLVNQTYKNIEIICVDDGSTDNCSAILNEYEKNDKRLKVIHKENGGLSDARNTGIKIASGKYVMYVDSDDWIDLDTCEKAVNYAERYNCDVVMWSYVREYDGISHNTFILGKESFLFEDDKCETLKRKLVGLINEELKRPQDIDHIVTAWGKLYKKSVVNGMGFIDTKIIGTEDALFNIMVFERVKSVFYIPTCFNHYRKTNETALTRNYKPQLVKQWKTLYEIIDSIIGKRKEGKDYYQALDNRICLGLICIGLNLIEDKKVTWDNKKTEMQSVLQMNHYRAAFENLQISYMPIHWKVFFWLGKYQKTVLLLVLLQVMAWLKKYV